MEGKRIGRTEGVLKILKVMAESEIKNVGGVDAQEGVVQATAMIVANVRIAGKEMRKINAATLLRAEVQRRVMMKRKLSARNRQLSKRILRRLRSKLKKLREMTAQY